MTLIPRGNTLLEICTPDIRILKISAGYHRGRINGYQEKFYQILFKYLADFNKLLKNNCWI